MPRRSSAPRRAARPHAGRLVGGADPSRREAEPGQEPDRRDRGRRAALVGHLPVPPRRRQLCRRARSRLHHPRLAGPGGARGRRDVRPHRAAPRRGRDPPHAGRADPRLAAVSAMGTMASTLAHELNQPLTALAQLHQRRQADRRAIRTCRARCWSRRSTGPRRRALRAGEILRRLRELVSRGTVSVGVEHLPQLIEEAGVLAFVDEHALGVRHRLDLDPDAAMGPRRPDPDPAGADQPRPQRGRGDGGERRCARS